MPGPVLCRISLMLFLLDGNMQSYTRCLPHHSSRSRRPRPCHNQRGDDMNDKAQFDQQHFHSLYPKVKFSRRGFIASSFAAGFAVSAGPVMAQQVIKTPADGLEVGEGVLPVAGGNLPIYFAAPKKPGKY